DQCGTLLRHPHQSEVRRQIPGLLSRRFFFPWTIMQDPTQQGTQKNIFVAWDGRDWITLPTAPILAHHTFTFFPAMKSAVSARHFRSNEEVR
ncbi:hypothetical protein AVEN_69530-1, partial [Araneus ventricosus]